MHKQEPILLFIVYPGVEFPRASTGKAGILKRPVASWIGYVGE